MSVYKECVHILKSIESQQVQIFSDACDFGVPVSKMDKNWMQVNQLLTWYGILGSRKVLNYSTGRSVSGIIQYMPNEHVSNKMVKVRITYTTCDFKNSYYTGDGYISIEKLK